MAAPSLSLWTLCPEVRQGTGPASEAVLALFVSPRDNGEFVCVSPFMREEAVYAKSATFAESQNTAAIGQIKQILLSSFVAQTSSTRPGVILVKPSEQRDNNGGDSPYVP